MQIKVCIGSSCHLKGSYTVITTLQQIIEEDTNVSNIELKSVFCLGNCQHGVCVQLDDDPMIYSVRPDTVNDFYFNTVLPKLGVN